MAVLFHDRKRRRQAPKLPGSPSPRQRMWRFARHIRVIRPIFDHRAAPVVLALAQAPGFSRRPRDRPMLTVCVSSTRCDGRCSARRKGQLYLSHPLHSKETKSPCSVLQKAWGNGSRLVEQAR
ncbi:uncharacterized protein K452DRAFT_88801 [Aplosporella prunicola CBS 121167]|uniref:Uncharacterized protein n=1 Tax=Aplosporella prunicola CBS 121167 TaxID=1176127 RepID=A0A6A6B5A0_9PEZI|nr:uncharacterized protein K452DRAFT_88801 [Aplosporella prunicola CBS 121167]KAF2138593.1 hypothetical protein K452DRAFT_88801 [Aplosporella prunicola CBS 121167]